MRFNPGVVIANDIGVIGDSGKCFHFADETGVGFGEFAGVGFFEGCGGWGGGEVGRWWCCEDVVTLMMIVVVVAMKRSECG